MGGSFYPRLDALIATLIIVFAILNTCQCQTEFDNLPPVWDDTSLKFLTAGIREDTPIGTFLMQLKCEDPDGDKIKYTLIKGNAVSVNSTGAVFLNVKLDFEKKDTIGYDLAFGCYDADQFGFPIHNEVEHEVELTVDDANDNSPILTVNSIEGFSFSVAEDDSPGYVLKPMIFIQDLDRSSNAELSYLYIICASTFPNERIDLHESSIATCQKFGLRYKQLEEGHYNASLVLNSQLDYETRRVYSSKLIAIDNPEDPEKRLSTTINIQINVQDAQDMDPVFVNLGDSTIVSEGAVQGQAVNLAISAKDGDIGDKRAVKIVMLEDRLNAFTLDPATESSTEPGIYSSTLRVKNAIDREQIVGPYDFVVKVIELDKKTGAETTATATATYSVQVSDIDDETPQFEEDVYSVNVTEIEASQAGTQIQITGLRMVVNDRDEAQNAKYTVRIVSQTYPGAFKISPDVPSFTSTAILFLSVNDIRYLDYDVPAYRSQRVVLEARSLHVPPLSSTTTVNIALLDINDNKPLFKQDSYELEVSEAITSAQLPYYITTINATDLDSNNNGLVTYSLEGGTSDKFEIDPRTGALSLVGLVDYESTPLYVFLVYAVDNAKDKRADQVQVSVRVKNVNDKPPEFEQSLYQTSVNEDELNFLTPITVSAVDDEEGTNRISYSIISGQTADNAFSLNPNTGSLTLVRNLKYVKPGIYVLTIGASDNGNPPQTAEVTVRISVIDQNNFSPVISPKVFSFTLSELVAPGTLVATVTGSDRDEGEFGRITYRITTGGFDNFVIDQDTGVIRVNDPQNFDYDQKKTYSVTIVGSDGGAPQLFDTATLNVVVTDANNKAPVFEENIYIKTVDEKNSVGYTILTVKATDMDSTSNLVYTIQPGSISARNGAGNLLSNTFNYNYVEAIGVREKTGEVFIKNKLDKEKALELTFIVEVKDLNAQTNNQIDTTRVALTVVGEANTDLTFDPVDQSFVNEGSDIGYGITTVVARDPTNQDGVKNYQQIGTSQFFEVLQATGEVRIKNKIDYETDPHTHFITIKAIADDNIRSVTTTVTIKINDDNDNAPKFEKSEYTATIDEDAPSLTRVANLFATDVDTPSYGPIEYRIGGGLDIDTFELYEASPGVDVLLARGASLDYNNRTFYELDIVALDNPLKKFSNVQKFSSVKLKIQVIDKNNHKPTFLDEGTTRNLAVAETAPIGKSVGTLEATDDDYGVNGEISYYLQSANHPTSERGLQLFTVVSSNGIIQVAQSLVGFGGNRYKVQVLARDAGSPYLSSTLDAEIEVLSTENDDGNPVWHSPPNNFMLTCPEETVPCLVKDGSNRPVVFDVSPRTGNAITYSLSPRSDSASSFSIDRNTGAITITGLLDRERKPSYKILVFAEDTSNSSFIRTGRQFIVELGDKDDNMPTFTNPNQYEACGEPIARPLEFFFDENIPKETAIHTLKACDPDVDQTIYYYKYNANDYCDQNNADASVALQLTEDGRVVTTKQVDYEEHKFFRMCVIALPNKLSGRKKRAATFDMTKVDASLNNVAYILINVRDLNDNAPIFPKREVTAVMLTDARDYPVVILDAKDKDGPGYNNPIYTIVDTKFYGAGLSSNPRSPGRAFVIKNNEIHPDPPRGFTFQEFAGGRFVLTVRAEDPVNPDFYDTQIVTIYVHMKGQAVKVILDMKPEAAFDMGEKIVTDLNDLSEDYAFRYLHVSVHNDKDGLDRLRTDVCFVVVNSNTHHILDIFELVSLLDRGLYRTVLDQPSYQIQDRGKCYPSTSSEEQVKWRDLWWVLVVLAIFIGFCSLVFIVIIIFMYRRYRRYMETEKTYLVPQ